MLARVAESIYWMARYCERAEDLARLINVNSHLLLDLPRGIAPGWRPLIDITGSGELYAARYPDYQEANVLHFLMCEPQSPSSILNSLNAARENARTVREVIPREVWELINSLALWAREHAEGAISRRHRFEFLNEVILRCQTLNGVLSGSMNHDQGYTFFRLGRNLERADMTTRIIDVRAASLLPPDMLGRAQSFDNLQWMSVLRSLTAYQMYRQSMNTRVKRAEVLKFLFHSEVFPRAVMHCLSDLEEGLRALPNNAAVLATLARVRQLVKCDVAQFSQTELHHFIDDVQIGLSDVAGALSNQYFLSGLAARHGAIRAA